jgi:hypothetical protein
MRSLLRAIGTVAVLVLVGAMPVSGINNVVTPGFAVNGIRGGVVQFSTEETILGTHSVEMYIPASGPPAGYGSGLNAEVRLATGMSRSRGLVLYDGISFKAKPANPGRFLYVSLILYDRTNGVWVSMLNYGVAWVPASDGWYIVTVPVGASWDGWTFGGSHYGPGYVPLADWDNWVAQHGVDLDVRRVNIQFGYDASLSSGTAYVDGLSFADRTLDFEPEAD